MHAAPRLNPRAVDRRSNATSACFPLLLSGGRSIERERRHGDRRRLGFISRLDLFHGVPYSAVEEVLAGCPVRQFESEQVLLEPGQANAHVFLVLEGRLRVHLDAKDSGNAIMIEVGECIGEMSVIDGKPVSAFVVAEKNSRILMLDQEQLWSRILTNVQAVRNLLRMLTERMRRSTEALLKGLKERLILEHIQKELRLAHEIQEDMLPGGFALPGLADRLDLHARMQAAREVGGDLYDFFVTPQGGLCLVVGDVSDKGMPAALFMARTIEIVRLAARLSTESTGAEPEPAAILTQVNRSLCSNNPSRMFVSMFLALLDPRTGALRYCNAGHNPPYVRSHDGGVTALNGMRNVPLGIKPGIAFRGDEARLSDGETLFVYTDGITEAVGPGHALFGEERLERVLREARFQHAAALTSAVLEEVRRFAGAAVQSDDITMLAVRVLPGA